MFEANPNSDADRGDILHKAAGFTKGLRSASLCKPLCEGDLTQFVGRECLPSELTVSEDTPRSAERHRDSTSCAISSSPTSEFGLNWLCKRARVLLLALALVMPSPVMVTALADKTPGIVLTNPFLPIPSHDPWLIVENGTIYQVYSNGGAIYVRSSQSLADLPQAKPKRVWKAPERGPNSKHVWAPEMHWLAGKWWIYYTADDGKNENHRIFVLESKSADLDDGFIDRGQWETDGWAIDATVFTGSDGKLYALWSGWPGPTNGEQRIYIAPMSDPATLSGKRVSLASPSYAWERVALPLCEGPQILQRGERTFLIYSASGSWTEDYCLGMLVHQGGDYLDPLTWKKLPTPVFAKTETVWGVGHCAFLKFPETGDLLFYHAKTQRKPGWRDREVRVQPFTWDEEGMPVFGKPTAPGLPVTF